MKLYPNKGYYRIKNKDFYKDFLLKFYVNTLEETQTVEYRRSYKELCNKVRMDLNETRIIGFGVQGDYIVDVLVYEIYATEDNHYMQKWEVNSEGYAIPYIEVAGYEK